MDPPQKKARCTPIMSHVGEISLTANDGLSLEWLLGQCLREGARRWAASQAEDIGYFSTPWLNSEACSITAKCIRHAGCRSGHGKSYRFRGKWDGEQFRILVEASSSHVGEDLAMRQTAGSSTRSHKADVEHAACRLAAQGRVTPMDVVKEMTSAKNPCPKSDSLRGLLRRWKLRAGVPLQYRKSRKETWTADFEALVGELRTDEFLQVKDVIQDTNIVAFTLLFRPMFDFLKQLQTAQVLRSTLVVLCDCTFNIEWKSYVWGCVGAVIYRNIRGRWRKTFLVLLLHCRPREDKANYSRLAARLRDELQAWGLPKCVQVGGDHFSGNVEQFEAVFPGIRKSRSLWHLLKNVKRNQRTRGAPKVKGRPLHVVLTYIKGSCVLPSLAMFSLVWEVWLARISHVWKDQGWASYFQRHYLTSYPFEGPENSEEGIGAQWYYGLLSGLVRGQGPWQLPLEQANGHLKEAIARMPATASMVDIVREIRKVSAAWGKEPEDKERAFSRRVDPSRCSTKCPTTPSKWMLGVEGRVVASAIFHGRVKSRVFGMEAILQAYYSSRDTETPTVQKQVLKRRRDGGAITIYCMRIHRPGAVSKQVADELLAQVQIKKPSVLKTRWLECGILSKAAPEHEQVAPFKLNWKVLKQHWGQYCLISHSGQVVECTCPVSADTGHWPHRHAVEEITGIAQYRGRMQPTAAEGARALREAGSSDDNA
eukprot:TRINITY_DN29371_c0_g1_i1.p1 TRINITY_DN29371_c0_g1~~TRINITY_DN29371_c0_g1_i1.p1  ORF type:complete len:741 (-),score=67.32 TRINITY_DN29371_c0_g1_i1:305-2431(-)